MNPAYVNNIPLVHGEVTIVLSDSVTESVRHSAELAKQIRAQGVNALLLNCGMSDQHFRHHANPIIGDDYKGKNSLELRSCVRGNLIEEEDAIRQLVFECRTGVLIINSWEWTSSSWRRKNNLIYFLRGLMEDTGIAVIVYSTAKTKPEPGIPDRGGVGRLSEIAINIRHLGESEKLKNKTNRPKPLVIRSMEEWYEAERSAQLIKDKLKSYGEKSSEVRLPDLLPDLAR